MTTTITTCSWLRLTGVKGGLIRGTVKARSGDSLARYLDSVKQKIEAASGGR